MYTMQRRKRDHAVQYDQVVFRVRCEKDTRVGEAKAKAKEQKRLDLINARRNQTKSASCPADMTPATWASVKERERDRMERERNEGAIQEGDETRKRPWEPRLPVPSPAPQQAPAPQQDPAPQQEWQRYNPRHWDEAWENPARGNGPTPGASSSSTWHSQTHKWSESQGWYDSGNWTNYDDGWQTQTYTERAKSVIDKTEKEKKDNVANNEDKKTEWGHDRGYLRRTS